MADQAATLKDMAREGAALSPGSPGAAVVAVTSGKGGVGKTNIASNLAICLARGGDRVVLMDADLGLGSVDVLLGVSPAYTMQNMVEDGVPLSDVMLEGPGGIRILPAGSGALSVTGLSDERKGALLTELMKLEEDADILLLDTGAGISENVLYFCRAAGEVILVTSPEPTAVTDAYAVIKVLHQTGSRANIRVLVNNVRRPKEAQDVFESLRRVSERFLGVALDYCGMVPVDTNVPRSVVQQKAFIQAFPASPASRAIEDLAMTVVSWNGGEKGVVGIRGFWERIIATRP
ncbi:MAG TPA: MinD/ParA family protein [Nitrospirota bacterium]|jgi:flagellar biosynthesis protein FlhG